MPLITPDRYDLYNPDFTVIDESEDWLVVDKPAHLLVHPSKPGNPPTLLDGLEQLLAYELATGGQISITNRLDRETSGIVMVAKHREAAIELGKAMAAREFTKHYLAIAHGWPKQNQFEIDHPIIRKGEISDSKIHLRQAVHPKGKPCCTAFEVLDRLKKGQAKFSLLHCHPVSGRMHQIRVHLESCGHSLVGDKIYGHSGESYLEFISGGWSKELEQRLRLRRHALHASELKWKDFHWKSPLPGELREFLKK